MKTINVTRLALENDQRTQVAEMGFGAADWDKLVSFARAAKKAGLHLEIDPAAASDRITIYVARRSRTRQRA